MPEKLIPVQEVIFTPVPDLAKPVVIVSAATIAYLQECLTEINTLEVTDEKSFHRMAELLNHVGKGIAAAKNHSLDLGRPFRDESTRIKTDTDVALVPALGGQQTANQKLMAWKKIQEAEFVARKAEADRKAAEAKKREAEALAQLDKAKNEKGFEKAAQAFDKSQEVAAQAVQAAVALPVALAKPKGVKVVRTAVIDEIDQPNLPRTYLEPNETKIKRHILDGTITKETPGLKFHIEESFGGTGR